MAAVAVAFFGLLAFAVVAFPSKAMTAGERLGAPLAMLAIGAVMVWVFFFPPTVQTRRPAEDLKNTLRADIERRFSGAEGRSVRAWKR